jgi:hypothetical protein
MLEAARLFWRNHVPPAVRNRVNSARAARRDASWRKPRKLGDLRRTTPFTTWGAERGGSIPRYYIAKFLEEHVADIRGHVLEIASVQYVRQFGRDVSEVDILDIFPNNERATIIADFADARNVPDNTFDCLIVTQVLSWIYDVHAPFKTAHRILRPGVSSSRRHRESHDWAGRVGALGEWWHFTAAGARRVGEETFGEGKVCAQAFGNAPPQPRHSSGSGCTTLRARSWTHMTRGSR